MLATRALLRGPAAFVGDMSSLILRSRTFWGYSNDTLSQEKAWLVPQNKTLLLNRWCANHGLDTDECSEGTARRTIPYRSVAESIRNGKKVKRQPIYRSSPAPGI
jgi:hypothetical protein